MVVGGGAPMDGLEAGLKGLGEGFGGDGDRNRMPSGVDVGDREEGAGGCGDEGFPEICTGSEQFGDRDGALHNRDAEVTEQGGHGRTGDGGEDGVVEGGREHFSL